MDWCLLQLITFLIAGGTMIEEDLIMDPSMKERLEEKMKKLKEVIL